MKKGRFAIYFGEEYSAGTKNDGRIILRSTDLKDISNGFRLCEPFKFRDVAKEIVCTKYVNRSEIEDYYKLITRAVYSGHEFEVDDEKDKMVSIVAMTGDYRVWLGLGMKCIDKGVYQKWVNKNEVQIRTEKEQL